MKVKKKSVLIKCQTHYNHTCDALNKSQDFGVLLVVNYWMPILDSFHGLGFICVTLFFRAPTLFVTLLRRQ